MQTLSKNRMSIPLAQSDLVRGICSILFWRELTFMEQDSGWNPQRTRTNAELNNCSEFALSFMGDACLSIQVAYSSIAHYKFHNRTIVCTLLCCVVNLWSLLGKKGKGSCCWLYSSLNRKSRLQKVKIRDFVLG